MSQVKISGDVSGTGILTIAAPNTNSNFTLTLPATTAPILAGSGITLSASAPANTLVTDASGNVGIGTSTGTRKLNVFGGASNTRTMTVTSNASEGLEVGVNASNIAAINSAAGGAIIFTQADTERMRIDSSGNVGIGTSSPTNVRTRNLEVSSSGTNDGAAVIVNKRGTGIATMRLATVGAATGFDINFNFPNTGDLGFLDLAASTTRMVLDSSGNLLVGTTSNNGRITAFTDSAAGRAGFFMINAASSLGSDAVGISKFDNNTSTSQVFVKFFINNNAAASGLITANGANQATFTSSSDARLKENIVELSPQLDNIMALRPVEFDYIESEGGGHQIGFIAQEVQEVYPDVVGSRADGMFLVSDMNKNDARLIKCIQEQQALITGQQAMLASLTARITALEQT